jgi:hypothetical protein
MFGRPHSFIPLGQHIELNQLVKGTPTWQSGAEARAGYAAPICAARICDVNARQIAEREDLPHNRNRRVQQDLLRRKVFWNE